MTITTNTLTAGGYPQNVIYTVATLPVASTVVQGFTAFVTDALAPAITINVAGGGAVLTRVFSDGVTNWKVG